jgi:hypothetical protein
MDPGPPLFLSHADMNAAYHSGDAVPLAITITWLTRYKDAWWVIYERGWLRVTDELTAADIDDCAARLATQASEVTSKQTQEESCQPPR